MKKLILGFLSIFVIFIIIYSLFFKNKNIETIKVGILHSLTGTMAISEVNVANATQMAIDEINANGGLLGKKIEVILVDGKSDLLTFEKECTNLIVNHKVSAIFGCWTSASRKTIKPIIEKYNNILFYPVQYEGLESSKNIIYTGSCPNQQITPAVKWCIENLGKNLYLVGSDYIFPHCANLIIKEEVKRSDAKIVGEDYILLGSNEVKYIISKIESKKPDVIINTLNGGTNRDFFRELHNSKLDLNKTKVISFSLSESEIDVIGGWLLKDHYASWSYFQSIKSIKNQSFINNFKKLYGKYKSISDPMEAGYFGVYLWANSVKKSKSIKTEKVLKAIKGISFEAPQGKVTISNTNNHTIKNSIIGKIKQNGQFEIVWQSDDKIEPNPFPDYMSKDVWKKIVNDYYHYWGESWANSK